MIQSNDITIARGQTSTIDIRFVQQEGVHQSYIIAESATLYLTLHEQAIGNNLVLDMYCYKDAVLYFQFCLKKTVDLKVNIHLIESGAYAQVKGSYVLQENDKVTIATQQLHMAPHTYSDLIIKGVLDDSTTSHYHGKIFVAQPAYATKANQQNKNMLLSPHAKAISIPSLEVLTDDVQCAHGSAAGYVDHNQLFYLTSRGLSFDYAKTMLIRAFLQDVQ